MLCLGSAMMPELKNSGSTAQHSLHPDRSNFDVCRLLSACTISVRRCWTLEKPCKLLVMKGSKLTKQPLSINRCRLRVQCSHPCCLWNAFEFEMRCEFGSSGWDFGMHELRTANLLVAEVSHHQKPRQVEAAALVFTHLSSHMRLRRPESWPSLPMLQKGDIRIQCCDIRNPYLKLYKPDDFQVGLSALSRLLSHH